MNTGFKVILYALLLIATAVTGYFFFHNFGKLFEPDKPKVEASEAAPAPADTNAPSATIDTNATASAGTNAAPAATNLITGEPLVKTNATAADTNATAQTNVAAAPPAAPNPPIAPKTPTPARSRIGLWTGLFLMCIIALGGLIAWDISNYMGNKSLRLLYNDEGVGMKDPEYDQAEQVWADGEPLEAIRMMRDYLNKNPREVHVSLRIAEIYEKDLNNFLAAALEYEEVLKKKLPDERWGWAAIHLCNLYFKLGQEVKAYALLQRVVKEYGGTQAAEKARKRLNEVDPGLLSEAEAPAPSENPAKSAPAADDPKSNLPPGFRPKK
jgi:TolA-binding protein